MRTRVYRLQRPTTFTGWIATILVLGFVAVLVVVFTTIGLFLLAAMILLGPIVAWWRRRRGPPAAPRTDAQGRRVIDVEYEVHDKPAPGPPLD